MKWLIWLFLISVALGQTKIIGPTAMVGPATTPKASAAAVVALVQHPNSGGSCSGTTCSITLTQSIVAGDFLIIGSNATNTGITISSINVGGTLVPCTGCAINGASLNTQGGWVLSSTSTAGPVVVTFSASAGGLSEVGLWEFSCTGGTVSHDIDGTANNSTDTTPYNGVPLTLSGTNDAIVQWSDGVTQDPTSITTYANFTSVNGIGMADLINTTSGTAPAWTAAANTGGKTAAAIAMKCQ